MVFVSEPSQGCVGKFVTTSDGLSLLSMGSMLVGVASR